MIEEILSDGSSKDLSGESISCSDREQSPLCFCQSSYRRSLITNIFLSKISLSQCANKYSTRQCRQGRFSPSSTHVTQLIPNLVNHSHCIEDDRCLHALRIIQRCYQCQITPSSSPNENTSYTVSTSPNDLPADSCFHVCEHDKSCGFLCFDRRITFTVECKLCRGYRRNVTCRCAREKQSQTCFQSTPETTTPRWMQKRGFPAAGILALLVTVTILMIIVIKLINRRIGVLAQRKHGSVRRSITTITTYRSRQPSPSIATSYPNTPLIPSVQLRNDLLNANTMVELLNDKSQEYVVDIHRHDDDEEDELSVFLLEKTSTLHSKSKEIADDDDDDDVVEEENQT
ncbi:unnamed protein product [Adineta steineri]|uniref:Uncharacterized protein n=1 Tax=Adineta steineri TaxID=433720 RepID=A0A814C314_9BILA|nr:unnamed protein product [Adineta steineri]CAF3649604.1 unnamed protein product [Adineta steineri]